MDGRCFCGKIRFSTSANPKRVGNCHCHNCKTSIGAPFGAWAIFKESHVTFHTTPKSHKADNGAVRTFCEQCGTSISYWHPSYKDKLDVVLTTLDGYETFTPKSNIWMKKKLQWLSHMDDMDNYEEFS